jgi:hypothetical protein
VESIQSVPWGAGDDAWVRAVDAWEWHAKYKTRHDGTRELVSWVKTGKCPRCGDEMTVEQPRGYGQTIEGDEGETVIASADKLKGAKCDCSGTHAGRPSEVEHGCGAAGYIHAAQSKSTEGRS